MKAIPKKIFHVLLSRANSLIGWINITIPAANNVKEQQIKTKYVTIFGMTTNRIK